MSDFHFRLFRNEIMSPQTPQFLNAKQWLVRRACAGVALVALADWFFYQGSAIGVSLALFIAVMGLVLWGLMTVRCTDRRRNFSMILIIAGVLALVEDINALSLMFGIGGLIVASLILASSAEVAWPRFLRAAFLIPFVGIFRLIADLLLVQRASMRRTNMQQKIDWVGWIVPLVVGCVFLFLFATANPLVESQLMAVDLSGLFSSITPWRLTLWCLILFLVWPILHVRALRKSDGVKKQAAQGVDLWSGLMSADAVWRSLILFNVLFVFQTVMDFGFLWGGLALPAGTTHAAYAHRGAYPLVVTALLAAAFVLVALRRNGPTPSRWARHLIFVFVGQNIMLVLSSILRLNLYIAAYSLTYWRVAAFIWMGLVMFGLLTIVVRIIHAKTSAWLFGVNAAALGITLYACCFLNFPDIIARYNLAHCREISGAGPELDVGYLRELGSQAIPAIDEYRTQFAKGAIHSTRSAFLRNGLPVAQRETSRDWRGWSFSKWRLDKYLAKMQDNAAAPAE